ncbi:zinc-ribbon and DUF3426 domain-containing protein [Aquimonas voraii]|uniref:MJ0042 family finger-like domain-containing protein n=1 Tax=Aquimonas voraii TaxID=265719 RepID=A0A1G6ZEI9_9GAMM|nr:zinc-ribbon and DUF3426 domain-containing protein [Aquimonas voraii]SDE00285.1 MJ0042 family finger-like domain-containing protein [Aquimonas voraii]
MYTQCPHCLTVHALNAAQIALGRGELVCGVCEKQFNGLERLADTPAQAAAGYGRGSLAQAPRVLPEGMVDPRERSPEGVSASPQAPQFALRRRRAKSTASARWWAATALLGLLLTGQIVLAQRAELAQDPVLRPWLQRLCVAIGCDLPAYAEPARISLLSRDVSPHPSVPDALLISASFRNDAVWPQAWPVLEISMSDLDGRLVALRRFAAVDYLGQAPERDVLAPGESVLIELEVVDPGNQAIAFEFSFL